jgi:tetratricopeptide (TPR) repeat protein
LQARDPFSESPPMLTERSHIAPALRFANALRLFQSGDPASAARASQTLIDHAPTAVEPVVLLGRIMFDAADRARASANGVAALGSASDELAEADWLRRAESYFHAALALDPSNVEVHRRLGRTLTGLGEFDAACQTFRTCIDLDPENDDHHLLLADAQQTQGDYGAAVQTLEALIGRRPSSKLAHLYLFATLYIQGDHQRAWRENEWRLEGQEREHAQPAWDGSPLEGRSILLRAEQGMGDQIQFVRYARHVRERGGRVIVECHPGLYRLLLGCDGIDQVVKRGSEVPHFDIQVWPESLPHLLGTTLKTIPADVPYLSADPLQTERWRKLLNRHDGLRIGINWAGNRSNVPGQNREIPISCFFGLARMKDVHLFSLQKGEGADALRTVPGDIRLPDLGQFFRDMQHTAAVIEALDLVITNDTSIAHLAGALGKPVWVVLSRQACWRWQHDRGDCPWYPTMRLFRQGWTASWGEAFTPVEAAVGELLALSRAARADAPPREAEVA